MHDVRVTFDEHEIFDTNGSVLGDSPQIIAAKIDEHDVFRSLFLIVAELFCIFFVFCFRSAARQRPRNRTVLELAVTHANQHFGRRTDDRRVWHLQEVHVG